MTSNTSNIYMKLLNLHKDIKDKLNESDNYDKEKIIKIRDLLSKYNNELQNKQNDEGSTEKNVSHPTKVHILIGSFYKCLYFVVMEIIGCYGIIEINNLDINTILNNISNVSKYCMK